MTFSITADVTLQSLQCEVIRDDDELSSCFVFLEKAQLVKRLPAFIEPSHSWLYSQ